MTITIRTIAILLLSITIMTLTACGDSSGDSPQPPSAPVDLTLSYSGTTITVNWSAVSDATSYNIYWNDGGVTTSEYVKLDSTSDVSYSHTGITAGVNYSYQISAVNSGGEGSLSTGVSVTPLAMPTGVVLTPLASKVLLQWDAMAGADSYNIYWNDSGVTTTEWTLLDNTTDIRYPHTALTNDVAYNYQITAVESNGESSATATATATPRATPGGVTNISTKVDATGQLTLNWKASTNTTSYRVYYDTATVNTSDSYVDAVTNTATLTIPNERQYNIKIMPYNHDVAGSLSANVTARGNSDWVMHTPGYGVVTKRAIAHDSVGGVYVGVGDRGLIIRSTDAVTWSVQNSGNNDYDLRDVAWTGSRFVAVGYKSTDIALGIVMTSSDGVAWTVSTDAISSGAQAVATNGSRLVAVGFKFAAYSDDDGDTWTDYVTMAGSNVSQLFAFEIFWDGSQFLIGEIGLTLSSSDGGTWAIHQLNGTNYPMILQYAVGGSTYVLAGHDGLYSSSDGYTYTKRQGPPAGAGGNFYFYSVVWDSGNNQFVAMGVDTGVNDSAVIYSSSDGITWTEMVSAQSRYTVGLFTDGLNTLMFGDRGLMKLLIGSTWVDLEDHGGVALTGIESVGTDGWVAVGNNGLIGTSADGSNWNWSVYNCSTWSINTNWRKVVYHNNLYVVVGNDGCIITSSNGTTWTEMNSTVTDHLNDVAWDGTQYIAIGATGVIVTSPDATTWTKQTTPVADNLARAESANGVTVVVGNSGTILTSSDGVSWTQQTSSTTSHLRSLAYYNGSFVTAGGNGTMIASNDNGVSWNPSSDIKTTSTATLRAICATNSGLIAFNDWAMQFSSSDGINWEQLLTLPISITYDCKTNASGKTMISGLGGLLMSR